MGVRDDSYARATLRVQGVVVTGLGAVTPVGNNVADTWNNLIEGKSGIATITLFFQTKLPY